MLADQLCLTLCDPVDCSLAGSSVHGVLQARILEWVAILFSKGSSRPRDQTWVSCTEADSLLSEPRLEMFIGNIYIFHVIHVKVKEAGEMTGYEIGEQKREA